MPHADLDGLKLYYERAGSGEPELLFVPGWCCDHTMFKPQFDHFARTHTVTALDLRGVGRSDSPRDGYTIPELADDVEAFCGAVGIERPVVVGHSLGGMIAVELGGRRRPLPRALVLVDPGPIDPLPASVEFFTRFAEELEGPDGPAVRRAYVHDFETRDDELARSIVERMCLPEQAVAAAVVRGISRWNGRGASRARPPPC
ncbi:MAG TPA: alpha/beta hydrolase [Gaiellaceae bacterium]|nr:alpha/beta hydrolase [Gaiellaceae bacterium]